jgi:hypothetical protein
MKHIQIVLRRSCVLRMSSSKCQFARRSCDAVRPMCRALINTCATYSTSIIIIAHQLFCRCPVTYTAHLYQSASAGHVAQHGTARTLRTVAQNVALRRSVIQYFIFNSSYEPPCGGPLSGSDIAAHGRVARAATHAAHVSPAGACRTSTHSCSLLWYTASAMPQARG